MLQVSDFPFAEVFDTQSLLVAGSLFLFSVLLVQIIWVYRRRSGSQSRVLRPAATDDADDDMVICPECSEPTEAEYRYCRHCAGDTGKSYVGSRGDDGSKGSGML
jgi:rubredoxin